jgi:hypothetical protein
MPSGVSLFAMTFISFGKVNQYVLIEAALITDQSLLLLFQRGNNPDLRTRKI